MLNDSISSSNFLSICLFQKYICDLLNNWFLFSILKGEFCHLKTKQLIFNVQCFRLKIVLYRMPQCFIISDWFMQIWRQMPFLFQMDLVYYILIWNTASNLYNIFYQQFLMKNLFLWERVHTFNSCISLFMYGCT